MKASRFCVALLGAVVMLFFGMAPAGAAPLELKLGHPGNPGQTMAWAADRFAERVNAELGDKVKVVVFGSSQLGKDKEMLRKLRLGTAAFSEPSTILSSEEDRFGLFDMPYLVKDRDHMHRIEEAIFWSKIEPPLEKKGLKVLAIWENGYRQITNNIRPINTPADLQGIKLRTPKGKWRIIMFKAYGANPTPMAFSELFTALQTGTVDGQENPLTNIYAAKFQEVQKYLSISNHVYTPAYLTTGVRFWSTVPKDVAGRIQQIARDLQPDIYKYAAEQDEVLRGKLQADGMQVNVADRASFVKASKSVYEQFAKDVPGGKELIDAALSLAD